MNCLKKGICGGGTPFGRATRQTTLMGFERIAWAITTAVFVAVAAALFVSGYVGYGGVFLAVAAAAAVNVLPEISGS